MVRPPRSSKGVILAIRCVLPLLLAFFLGIPNLFAAEATPNAELESVLQKMESRSYRWIAIRSDVLVFFAKADNPQAMCSGELLYQRLDERMLLTCVDNIGELVFAFRTLDRRFDLYLPAQKTVYHGSIFDLENSPDIESHLKARDLYRALKPLAVDPRRARIERNNSVLTSLEVFSKKEGKDVLARKLLLTPEGDVRGEVYYDAAGRPATEIQRYDFREIPGRSGAFRSIIYPKKVTILSPESKKGTAVFFNRVKALDAISPIDFLLKVPSGTREVFLEAKASNSRPSVAATPVPPSAQKAMPVYLATPLKKATAKKITPVEDKKEVPLPEESKSAPLIPAVVAEDQTPAKEADLVVKTNEVSDPTSPHYDQTTLDPSIEPTA